jgi:hypothetical protein
MGILISDAQSLRFMITNFCPGTGQVQAGEQTAGRLPFLGGKAKPGAAIGAAFPRGKGGLAFWPGCQEKLSGHGNPANGRLTLKRDDSQPIKLI